MSLGCGRDLFLGGFSHGLFKCLVEGVQLVIKFDGFVIDGGVDGAASCRHFRLAECLLEETQQHLFLFAP